MGQDPQQKARKTIILFTFGDQVGLAFGCGV